MFSARSMARSQMSKGMQMDIMNEKRSKTWMTNCCVVMGWKKEAVLMRMGTKAVAMVQTVVRVMSLKMEDLRSVFLS